MIRLNRMRYAILAVAHLFLLGCDLFPESSFELARESRLPKWFTLPAGASRADVTVTMSYYVRPEGHTATFVLLDAGKHTLAKVEGAVKGREPLRLKNPSPGFPPGYPSYSIVTVNGVVEIIEHRRMEPVFYVSDDPTVWVELVTQQEQEKKE